MLKELNKEQTALVSGGLNVGGVMQLPVAIKQPPLPVQPPLQGGPIKAPVGI